MSVKYRAVSWDRTKRIYDITMGVGLVGVLGAYIGVTAATQPFVTAETLILRGTALAALILLHVILCIGPMARFDRRWMPLLYNRRHLGVTMFVLALAHAVLAAIQFHGFGDTNPIVSIFTAYSTDYSAIFPGGVPAVDTPFEAFGALALMIFFVMAATSHDFWLRNLGASFWKAMHLGVFIAYGLVLTHVLFGALQYERNPALAALLLGGFAIVAGLHIASGIREARIDRERARLAEDGFIDACATSDLEESRGRTVVAAGARIALYMHQGRAFAVSNTCRHQGGPIAEGRIVDGCITCPWHGWNYRPEDGMSPPPFAEVLETYDTRVLDGRVFVRPTPNASGTKCEGAPCHG